MFRSFLKGHADRISLFHRAFQFAMCNVDMPLHTMQHAKGLNVCCRITTLEDSNFNQDQKAP
jgi:hypothetical protein